MSTLDGLVRVGYRRVGIQTLGKKLLHFAKRKTRQENIVIMESYAIIAR